MNKLQKLLKELTVINCQILKCEYCYIDDDWPNCTKPTTIADGYLRGFGFDDIIGIKNILKCPYFKENEIKTIYNKCEALQ